MESDPLQTERAEESLRTREPGWCVEHSEFAWRYQDGSLTCVWALITESGTSECVWTQRELLAPAAPRVLPDGPVVREVEGRLEVEWPSSPSEPFLISTGLFTQMIDQENGRRALVALVSAVRRVVDDAAGLNGDGQYRRALNTIGEIVRIALLEVS